jgi:hypothetical protein
MSEEALSTQHEEKEARRIYEESEREYEAKKKVMKRSKAQRQK